MEEPIIQPKYLKTVKCKLNLQDREKIQKTKNCLWIEDEDKNYETGCDNMFTFNVGCPVENGFIYCPYCGKKLKVRINIRWLG